MCPNCNEPLIVVELEGVEIDRCALCRGTWLDAGELEQIVTLAGVEPGQVTAAVQAGRRGVRDQRRCPRCHRKMDIVTIPVQNVAAAAASAEKVAADLPAAAHAAQAGVPSAEKVCAAVPSSEPQTVELDHCPAGHGLWFDPGELRAIVRSFSGDEAGAVAEFFSDALRHDLAAGAEGG